MLGTSARGSADMDNKKDIDDVSAVSPVRLDVVQGTIVTINPVVIQLVTHALIGQAGLNGQVVRLHVVLVKDESSEHVMAVISTKVTIAMDPITSPSLV